MSQVVWPQGGVCVCVCLGGSDSCMIIVLQKTVVIQIIQQITDSRAELLILELIKVLNVDTMYTFLYKIHDLHAVTKDSLQRPTFCVTFVPLSGCLHHFVVILHLFVAVFHLTAAILSHCNNSSPFNSVRGRSN